MNPMIEALQATNVLFDEARTQTVNPELEYTLMNVDEMMYCVEHGFEITMSQLSELRNNILKLR